MRLYSRERGTYIERVEDLINYIKGKDTIIRENKFDIQSKSRCIESLKNEKTNLEERNAGLLARNALMYVYICLVSFPIR